MQRFYHSLHANYNVLSRRIHIRPTLGRYNLSASTGRRTLHSVDNQPDEDQTQDAAFDAYCIESSSTEHDEPVFQSLSGSKLASILPRAQELGASNIVRTIANVYLHQQEPEDTLGHALLKSDTDANLLTQQQVIAVFNKLLTRPHNLEVMSTNILIYLGHILITDPASNVLGMDSILLTLLGRWSQEPGTGHEGHSHGTWVIFQLLRTMMEAFPERGHRHFRRMLQSKPWWPEGSTDIVKAIEDPLTIVRMFVFRCCISWRWWERAYGVANDLAQSASVSTAARPIQVALTNMMNQHIESTGLLVDTRLCATLICTMVDQPAFAPVDYALLQRFYRACTEARTPRPEVANLVYRYLRDKQPATSPPPMKGEGGMSIARGGPKKTLHSYLPPQGRRILSLLDLYHRTNDHNAARLLITDVQKRLDTIPSDILVPYLIFVIKLSFATEARAIYTMCLTSEDPDKGAITLLPSVSRHLVSLFISLADASYQRSLSRPKKQQHYTQKAQGLMEFANTVARRFRNSILPLKKWPHERLTTLARIYFAIGRFNGGLYALKTISDRADTLPDAYDMNVVLHTLASANLQAASHHLDYMISQGLEPEPSAYGTVAAQCLKQGDFNLAGEILAKGKRRGQGAWDSKLLGAICWHNISPDALKNATTEEALARLEMVLEHLGPSGSVREVIFRERTLGVRAANVALDLHRPDLALKFWMRCIQHKTIARQPNEKDLPLQQDQERLLRERILRESKSSTIVTWNLPQSIAEILKETPTPKLVRRVKKMVDEQKIPA